jgi:hypothetical protein
MDIASILFKCGVGTWITDIITIAPVSTTPGVGSESFPVGKNLPEDVGFIYGMNVIADGTGPDGSVLPTTTQNQSMYLNLKSGPTNFVENYRMSDLQNDFAGSPNVRIERYMPVAIPSFDLSKSQYINPNLYTGFNIHLYLWYVQTDDWKVLVKELGIKPTVYAPKK